jgi:hypothetical protein
MSPAKQNSRVRSTVSDIVPANESLLVDEERPETARNNGSWQPYEHRMTSVLRGNVSPQHPNPFGS